MLEKYKIVKGKTFELDAKNVSLYISNILKNPDAAVALFAEVDKAIEIRSKMPKAFKPYVFDKKTNKAIYYIKVENFYAFYYIDDKKKLMKFTAFLYARMKVSNILKLIKK